MTMVAGVADLLPLVAYVVTVAVAVPVTAVTLLLARRHLLEPVLTATLASVTALVVLGIGTLAALTSLDAGLRALRTAVVVGLTLVVAPLGLGTVLVRRAIGGDRDRALRVVLTGWPVALVVSAVVFVAPDGLDGTDVTTLGGPLGLVAVVVWAAVVLFGPAAVGLLVAGVRGPPGVESP